MALLRLILFLLVLAALGPSGVAAQVPAEPVEVRSETRRAKRVRGPFFDSGFRSSLEVSAPISISSAGLGNGFELAGRIEAAFGAGFVGHLFMIGAAWRSSPEAEEDLISSVAFGTGLRYGVLNPTVVVPYVQARARLHVWPKREDDESCSTDCSEERDVQFGIDIGVGAVIELSRSFSVELGGQLIILFADGARSSGTTLAAAPSAGFTLYF
ncbi:MAG: hypothetical protein AAGF12_41515 [Myxococcota bacterium]